MAIEVRRRDGKEYYYYKLGKGSVYLGTKEKPNRENVERMYKHFLQNKTRLAKEEQIFNMLRREREEKR